MTNVCSSALILLTLNAESTFPKLIESLDNQTINLSRYILLDSESNDSTQAQAIKAGFNIYTISRTEFGHGSTRQLGVMFADVDIVILMTQDAILASHDSFKNILEPFKDDKIGAVCGRQLPHHNSTPISRHLRLFNYPDVSSVKSNDDIPRLGIKAAFLSDSFAAYRRSALIEVGGFPSDVILGEDTFVAAKMLLAGWKVAYAADATCYHSHNYNMIEEFRRYFDIGVFHSREKWFIDSFGKPVGEGKKFVVSELKYLLKHSPFFIPNAMIRTGLKFIAYKLGTLEECIPLWLKRMLSMHNAYWK